MLAVHPHTLSPAQALAARDTHGLGLIHDAISATRVRRVNGDRCLRITCPWTEKNANLLIADRLICCDGQYYRITIPSRRERAGKKTISLEAPHVMYDLRHSYIVNIETAEDENSVDGITGAQALGQVLAGTPFAPGTVDIDEGKLEYLDLLEAPRTQALEQIIDRWGGEIVPDNWTISLLRQCGSDRGLQIRVGKNIDGVELTEDIGGVVTRLHVHGYQGANFEDINDGKDYLDSPAIGRYAFVRESYISFDDDEDPAVLLSKGREELEKLDKPKLSVRVNLARVRGSRQYSWYKDLERVDEGDVVTVHHEFLGQNVQLRVMEVEDNCLSGDTLSVTLADIGTEGLFKGFSDFVRTTEMVRKILDHDGNVRSRTLRGEIDLLTTRLIASGSYQNARVIEGKGALLENTNESSPDYGALYIGPNMLAIADSKNPDGSWAWRTFGTGKGFSGSELLAYSISGTKIMAHTIGAEHLVPEIFTEVANNATGQQLVMELSNGGILDADNPSTIASLRVYHQGVDITDQIPSEAVRWERISDNAAADTAFNNDPAHIGVKSIAVQAADVDFRGVLRCRLDGGLIYSTPDVEDGTLYFESTDEDAQNWTLEDGYLYYDGPHDYTLEDGSLYVEAAIGAGQVDTQLQNLKTSFISLTRRGLELYGAGYLKLRTGGVMEIQAGSSFNLRAGSGAKAIGISNDHAQEYVHWAGAENPADAPFYVKRDGSVRATKLQLNNSNITDFTAPIQDADRDNADASHPFVFDIFVPPEYTGIQSLKLSYKCQPFRAYSTGAASGGGATSAAGGGSATTSRSGGGGTSQNNNAVNAIGVGKSTDTQGSHTHTASSSAQGISISSSGSHFHSFTYEYGLITHTHAVPSHTHIIDIPSHTHGLPDHTHGIVYGIYQGPAATSCSVYVDGTYIGAWPSLVSYDVASWLSGTAGVITRNAWHTIAIYPNALTRVVAHIFGLALIGRATNPVH